MATREIDVLGAAIAETEKEIFGEAFGKEETVLDETGDRSNEEMGDGLEGQHEPDDEDDAVDETEGGEESGDDKGEEEEGDKAPEVKVDEQQSDTDKAAEPEPKPETQGRVPSHRLREQTERADKAEADRSAMRAELEAERKKNEDYNRRIEARLDAFMQQRQEPPKPSPEPKPKPDYWENPEGFTEGLIDQRITTELSKQNQKYAELSMVVARRFYGETFDKAHQTLASLDPRDPANQTTVRGILNSPDPGEAIMQWHRDKEFAREISGKDLATYRKQVADEAVEAALKDPEVRKRIFEEARAEASGAHDRPPNTITRLPKSLNGAKGGNSNREADASLYDDSDSAVFNSAFPRSP